MVDIVVPSVGESISEVQISKWLKKEGDWVAAGTDLVELETEKASVQVSAPEDGILVKILKKDEEFASVGDVIASFQAAAKGATGQPAAGQPAGVRPIATPIANPVSTPANTASQPAAHVMPSAQRMLDDNNVPAANVPATGPGGRLLKEDVSRYVAAAANAVGSTIASAGVAVSAATTAAAKSVAATISPPAQPTTSHATTAIVAT